MCPSGAVLLLLQVLLKFDILLAVPSVGLQEEKGSGLETIPEKKLDLQKEFSISLKLSRQLLRKTKALTRSYDAKRLSQIAKTVSFYHKLVQQLTNFEAIKENSKFSSQFEGINVDLRDLGYQVDYQVAYQSFGGNTDEGKMSFGFGCIIQFSFYLQIKSGGLSSDIQPISTPQILQHHRQWTNRQEVYIVLRSLESFLLRVARDFWMLRMRVPKAASPSKIF
ncbi:hypothetical protein L345_01469, partial [Ophiophagus hannah]